MIKDDGHDPLGHRGYVLVYFLLADLKVCFENLFNADSFFQQEVKIGNLNLEVIGS